MNDLPSEDAIASLIAQNASLSTCDSPCARGSQTSSLSGDFESFTPTPRQQIPIFRPPQQALAPERSQERPDEPNQLPFLEPQTETNYRDCVGEFETVLSALKPSYRQNSGEDKKPPTPPPKKHSVSREASLDQSIGIPIVDSLVNNSPMLMNSQLYHSLSPKTELIRSESHEEHKENENTVRGGINVKEATQIFNRKASEDAKILSPMARGIRKDQDFRVSHSIFAPIAF